LFCYDTLPSSPFPPNTMITIKSTLTAALLAVGLHAQLVAAPAKEEGPTTDPEHSRLVAARSTDSEAAYRKIFDASLAKVDEGAPAIQEKERAAFRERMLKARTSKKSGYPKSVAKADD